MWKPDVCFYHFPCDDGFASALVARGKWPDVQLVPINYGQPIPWDLPTGKHILIADFSFKPDVVERMAKSAASIVMLDHHKTAEADLKSYAVVGELPGAAYMPDVANWPQALGGGVICAKNVVALFDMNRSGARLTWDFCFPGVEPPPLILHVEDRDLWRMALPNTRAISLMLRSLPYDFTEWGRFAGLLEEDTAAVLQSAAAIERFYDRKIAEMADTAVVRKFGKYDDVPVAFAPYAFASDLAHELLQRHKEAPFAAVIVDAYGARTASLRSEDSRADVSAVAREFGGGGHRNAAGFRMPI